VIVRCWVWDQMREALSDTKKRVGWQLHYRVEISADLKDWTVHGMPNSCLQEGLLRERNKYLHIISNIYLGSKTHYSTQHYETVLVETLILRHATVCPSTCSFVFHRPQLNSFFLYPGRWNTLFPPSVQGYLPRQVGTIFLGIV